jgi:hypothetical protein
MPNASGPSSRSRLTSPGRKVTDAKTRVDRKITHRLSAERPLHAGFAVSDAESKRLLSPKTPGGGRSDAVKRLEAMIAYEAGRDITNQQARGLHMDSGAHRLTDANYPQQSSSKHSVLPETDRRPFSELDMLSNSLENRRYTNTYIHGYTKSETSERGSARQSLSPPPRARRASEAARDSLSPHPLSHPIHTYQLSLSLSLSLSPPLPLTGFLRLRSRDISPPGPRIRSSLHAASHSEHGEAHQSPESMPQSMLGNRLLLISMRSSD